MSGLRDDTVEVSVFLDGTTISRVIDGRKEAKVSTEQTNSGPSESTDHREGFRGLATKFEIRNSDEGSMPTLVGNLAVFNEWTEIRSAREGHFLERVAPGAFTKTVTESSDSMRVLFNHGRDPSVGEKPLGPIRNIEIDDQGVHYEVELLDTSYNRDLLPGLERGLYGSSFRFEVLREDVNQRAKKSDYNPKGLPERTVTELRMSEFGPVVFPAYPGAKSGIRSLTDEFTGAVVFDHTAKDVSLVEAWRKVFETKGFGEFDADAAEDLLRQIKADLPDEGEQEGDIAPANDRAGESHPVSARRDRTLYSTSRKETESWRIQ